MIDLANGDGHILSPPQVTFSQYKMSDVIGRGVDQEFIHTADFTISSFHASPSRNGEFVSRNMFHFNFNEFSVRRIIRAELATWDGRRFCKVSTNPAPG